MIHVRNDRGRSRCGIEKVTETKDGPIFTLPDGHALVSNVVFTNDFVIRKGGEVPVCFACRSRDIHIRRSDSSYLSVCGAVVPLANLVDAALQSGCDQCRVIVGVGGVADRGCEVRRVLDCESPLYEPEPELLDRDGKPYERERP